MGKSMNDFIVQYNNLLEYFDKKRVFFVNCNRISGMPPRNI